MLSQINTLQSQQEVLGERVESLSQTADSAMEREREAEERLDQALSVHAHQISQRQTRESELERTVSRMSPPDLVRYRGRFLTPGRYHYTLAYVVCRLQNSELPWRRRGVKRVVD